MKNVILNQSEKARKVLTATLVAAVTIGTVACSKNDDSKIGSDGIDVASIQSDITLTPEQKAEKLALAAEQLVLPTSFMYADVVASQALVFDSKNARARFWKAALGPAMAMQGIGNRIAPIASSRPQWKAKHAELVQSAEASPKAVRDFMMDGPQDIQNERDVQELVARVTLKLDELRRTIKDIKGGSLTIHLNEVTTRAGEPTCSVSHSTPDRYTFENCENRSMREVTINRADFEALQQMVAGYQVYFSILNSYDLSGTLPLLDGKDRAPEKVYETLTKNPAFGTLRANHGLGVVPELAADFSMGVRYAMEIRSEICMVDNYGQVVAKGPFGSQLPIDVCTTPDSEVESTLQTLEQMLSGQPMTKTQRIGEQDIPVTFNLGGFFKAPVKDLRTVSDFKVNECGEITAIGDGTFGGLFPTGDLNKVLEIQSQANSCSVN